MSVFGSGARRVIVFDIGSATVGGAIVDLQSGEKPHILHSIRAPIAFQDELDFDRFMRSMFGVFLDVSLRLESEGMPIANEEGGRRSIEDVFCVLSSSWYVNQTKKLRITKNEPFSIHGGLFEEKIESAVSDFHKDKEETSIQAHETSFLVEKKIIQMRLDGYATEKPHGKKAKDVQAFLYLSAMSPNIKDKIEEMAKKVFAVNEVFFSTIALVGFSVIRDLYQVEDHFLFVDVSGEVTEVSNINEDALRRSKSFPFGHNSVIREVSSALHILPEETPSRINIYVEGSGTDASNETVHMERVYEKIAEEWNSSLQRVLTNMYSDTPIPSTMFLVAGANYGTWFKEMIIRGDYSDILFVPKPFHIILLGEQQLRPCCKTLRNESVDPFIALGVLFFNNTLTS